MVGLQQLPPSTIFEIFLKLPISDISIMARTSSYFHNIAKENYLWKLLSIRDFNVQQHQDPEWNSRTDWLSFYQKLTEKIIFPSEHEFFDIEQNLITRKKLKDNHKVIISTTLLSPKVRFWYWKYLIITNISDNMVGYGFATQQVKRNKFLGGCSNGWSIYSGRFYYHKNHNIKSTRTPLVDKDHFLEFLFDTKEKICIVLKNDKYSHSFVDIPVEKGIFPALCMYYSSSCIKVLTSSERKSELIELYQSKEIFNKKDVLGTFTNFLDTSVVPFYDEANALLYGPILIPFFFQVTTIMIAIKPFTCDAPWLVSLTQNIICSTGGGTLFPILFGQPIPWIISGDKTFPILFLIWLLVHKVPFYSKFWETFPFSVILAFFTGYSHSNNVFGPYVFICQKLSESGSTSFISPIILTALAGAGGGIILPWIPCSYRKVRMRNALEFPNFWLQSAFWGAVFLSVSTGKLHFIPQFLTLPQARVILTTFIIFHVSLRAFQKRNVNDPPLILELIYKIFFGITGITRSDVVVSRFIEEEQKKRKENEEKQKNE